MELIARIVVEFTTWVEGDPYLLDMPTREVLELLRARLDEVKPGWRETVLAELGRGQSGIEVELLLESRTVRGALVQRPSGITSKQ